MKQSLKLVSPIPPSVNHYLAYRAIVKNGKPMAMSYKTGEAKTYQKEFIKYVRKEVFNQRWRPQRDRMQHYYVDADFYFPRVDMDANNYWKCMFDAITETGLIWVDDNTACERVNHIYYDSENPRVELTIRPVDYIGVFENASQMEAFEAICVGCKRYRRNCSVLQKAKEGRVQKEIVNGVCGKYVQDIREENEHGRNNEEDDEEDKESGTAEADAGEE